MLVLFNAHMATARKVLVLRSKGPSSYAAKAYLDVAKVRSALREANRMRNRKRAGLCLRVLNWLRAAELEA